MSQARALGVKRIGRIYATERGIQKKKQRARRRGRSEKSTAAIGEMEVGEEDERVWDSQNSLDSLFQPMYL